MPDSQEPVLTILVVRGPRRSGVNKLTFHFHGDEYLKPGAKVGILIRGKIVYEGKTYHAKRVATTNNDPERWWIPRYIERWNCCKSVWILGDRITGTDATELQKLIKGILGA